MISSNTWVARSLAPTLQILRWVLIIMLALLVPAMVVALLVPHSVSIAELLGQAVAPTPSTGDPATVLILAYACANLALMLVIVAKLRRMMHAVAAGQPFERANTTRLRQIAAAMAGLAFLATLVRPFVPGLARPGIHLATPDLNLGLWLAALVMLVFAEVFREGARLRDDADMTI